MNGTTATTRKHVARCVILSSKMASPNINLHNTISKNCFEEAMPPQRQAQAPHGKNADHIWHFYILVPGNYVLVRKNSRMVKTGRIYHRIGRICQPQTMRRARPTSGRTLINTPSENSEVRYSKGKISMTGMRKSVLCSS